MVFLLPLIGVVGPVGDQGLDGEYVPGRARLSFTTALLPGALFPSVLLRWRGGGVCLWAWVASRSRLLVPIGGCESSSERFFMVSSYTPGTD